MLAADYEASAAAGKMVLAQALSGPGNAPGISCSVMAVSNNLLFVADNRGCIYALRCDIKNGMLQVNTLQLCTVLSLLMKHGHFIELQHTTNIVCCHR